MSFKRRILSLFLPLIFIGCTTREYAKVVEVDPVSWHAPAEIIFEVRDTTTRVDLQLVVRYDNIISADSIELLVSVITPDNVMWSEPFTLYTPRGEQSIHILESPYRTNIAWGQLGKYKVVLHPQHNYQGVSAVGVNIINQN